VNGAILASFVPRLPELRDRIEVSTFVFGVFLTAAAVFGLVGSALASPLIERFGTRKALLGGGVLLVASLPILGFATQAVVFVIGLAMFQVFDVIVDVSMNLQGSWLNARRHAPIMNRLHGLWSLGTVIGGLLASRIAAAGVSLQVHLVAVAGVLLLALVFVGNGLLTEDENATDTDDEGARIRTTGSRTVLIALALAGGFAIAVEMASNDWAAFRMTDDFSTSSGFAALAFVAFTAGMTIGRFGGDSMQQRLGDDRLAAWAVGIATVGLATAALTPNRWIVLVGYAIGGIGVSTFFPRLYDQAAQMPGRSGAGLAALTAGSRVGLLAVPLVIGALANSSLSVGTASAIIVIPSALAFGLLSLRPVQ